MDLPAPWSRAKTPPTPGCCCASRHKAPRKTSDNPDTTLDAPALPPDLPKRETLTLTRDKFQDLVGEQISQAAGLLTQVLAATPGLHLDQVHMIGGSSLIPALRSAVRDATSLIPAERGDPFQPLVLVAPGIYRLARRLGEHPSALMCAPRRPRRIARPSPVRHRPAPA
jgi:hypothetical protein